MARYDGGWGRFPAGPRYDEPFRPYGPPPRVPGGRGYDRGLPGGGAGWGGGEPGRHDPWADVGARETGEREEFWEPGTVYGPARYGLGPYHERLRRQRRSDDELREEVEEALFYDTWVDADAITVEVRDGVVTLRGELPDFDEIRYATDDAWDVDGVRGVRSELTLRGSGRGAGRPQAAPAGGADPSGGRGAGDAAIATAAPGKRARKKPAT